jgi:hypothetical protein
MIVGLIAVIYFIVYLKQIAIGLPPVMSAVCINRLRVQISMEPSLIDYSRDFKSYPETISLILSEKFFCVGQVFMNASST